MLENCKILYLPIDSFAQSENNSALEKLDNEFFAYSEVETKDRGKSRTPEKH